jgi:hypothetical protein
MRYAIITPTLNRPDILGGLRVDIERFAPSAMHIIDHGKEPAPLTFLINSLVKHAFDECGVDWVVYLADYCRLGAGFEYDFLTRTDWITHPFMFGIPILNLPTAQPTCFWALNKEFSELFPDKQVQCPEYYHFYADTELGAFAKENEMLSMFDNGVTILHPNAKNAPSDSTHQASRVFKEYDKEVYIERQNKDLLWGKTDELTGRKFPWL